jgi:gliding motility-associated protein GldM
MYLVFIAMLALNMSKEVLTAFGLLNEKLTVSNQTTTQRNQAFMAGLAAKVDEQPKKYAPLKEKADKVDEISSNFNQYIEDLKSTLTQNIEDQRDYESMDRPDQLDELLFSGGNYTQKGEEFMQQIAAYREGVTTVIGDEFSNIASKVRDEFATEPVTDSEGITKPWLDYHYKGYPLVASLTKLTQIQADVKNTESEILSAMLSGQLQSEVSLTNYEAIVIPSKTAFFSGENFKGRVVLGRVDNTLQFDKVTVNGREIKSIRAGQVDLDFPAGNVGEQEIKGVLQFKEGDSIINIDIKSSYAVIPKPNSAVISADKMNVVYRGVKNPMTISIPGVGNVTANAPGLSPAGGAGNYVMDVTTVQAREVTISVSGKLPGGETVSDSKVFRIKDIPTPQGTIRGEDGSVKMQRNSLEISNVGATLPDFDFDLGLRVTGFSFKVAGQPTIQVRGNSLDAAAKAALRRAGRGETVQIFDIQAQLASNTGYMLKKVSPVFVELTN